MGLNFDQIYNDHKNGLLWLALPNNFYEDTAPGSKISKERVSFMTRANSSGTHRLELLVVEKSQNPRAVINSPLPVIYKGQKSVILWVDS
jgi:hypothetical protein